MQVSIKGQKYKVQIKDLGIDYAGLCYQDKKIIQISSEIKDFKLFLKVYGHELCHAYIQELKLNHIMNSQVEELVCLMFEDVLDHIFHEIKINKKDFK